MLIYLVCMALAIYHRNKSTYIYFKTLTSLSFVITGIYYGYLNQNFILIPGGSIVRAASENVQKYLFRISKHKSIAECVSTGKSSVTDLMLLRH